MRTLMERLVIGKAAAIFDLRSRSPKHRRHCVRKRRRIQRRTHAGLVVDRGQFLDVRQTLVACSGQHQPQQLLVTEMGRRFFHSTGSRFVQLIQTPDELLAVEILRTALRRIFGFGSFCAMFNSLSAARRSLERDNPAMISSLIESSLALS